MMNLGLKKKGLPQVLLLTQSSVQIQMSQVAVVNFASYAVVSSPCGALTNKNDFVNFMAALPRINGGTAINDGLLKSTGCIQELPTVKCRPSCSVSH